MEKKEIAIRYTTPTKHESAPYLTMVKVVIGMGEKETSRFYIQTSKNEEKPTWILMGYFLEEAFEELFGNETFMDETILMYKMAQVKKKSLFSRS